MKNLRLRILIGGLGLTLCGTALVGSKTRAQTAIAPNACQLAFRVRTFSVDLITGGSGRGILTCASSSGLDKIPLAIDIEGLGPGLGGYTVSGVAPNVGVGDPRAIVGDYLVANVSNGGAGASGISASLLGFKSLSTGVGFTATFEGANGFGAAGTVSKWHIRVLSEENR